MQTITMRCSSMASKGEMALFLFALMTILSITSGYNWQKRCTKVTSVTGQLKYKNRQTDEIVLRTTINTNLRLGETLCFKLEHGGELNKSDSGLGAVKTTSLMYQLKMTELKQVHPINNNYRFVIPVVKNVKCYCDCPCFADRHLTTKNFCKGFDEPCFQIFYDDQMKKDCEGAWICPKGSSTTLCSFSVRKSAKVPDIYKAIELASPTSWASFEIEVYDAKNGQKAGSTLRIAIDLGNGQQISLYGRLSGVISVSSPGQTSIIPPKWYFEKDSQGTLYTGIAVNALNDYSLDKLGWLRWSQKGVVFPNYLKNTLIARTRYRATSCRHEKYKWDFSGRYTENDFPQATKSSLLARYSSQLSAVKVNGRNVEAKQKTSSRMTVNLEFEETGNVIFFLDESTLGVFSAEIDIDMFSNKVLNFTLQQSAGSLTGYVRFDNEQDEPDFKFSLYVDSVSPVDTVLQISLPPHVLCNNASHTICLKAVSQKAYKCKRPVVHCEKNQVFVVPTWRSHTSGVVETYGNVWDGIKKFFEHINPVTWINALKKNISDVFGWLGFASNVIIIIIVLVVIKVVISKVNKCCSSK